MQTLKKLKEIRKEQAVIIANVVYGFQGSDPAIQKKQIGVEVAGLILEDIINDAIQAKKHEKIKAYIKKDKGDARWLIVERVGESAEVEAIQGQFRSEDDDNNVAYPILENEIQAIMRACLDYLVEKNNEKYK